MLRRVPHIIWAKPNDSSYYIQLTAINLFSAFHLSNFIAPISRKMSHQDFYSVILSESLKHVLWPLQTQAKSSTM